MNIRRYRDGVRQTSKDIIVHEAQSYAGHCYDHATKTHTYSVTSLNDGTERFRVELNEREMEMLVRFYAIAKGQSK